MRRWLRLPYLEYSEQQDDTEYDHEQLRANGREVGNLHPWNKKRAPCHWARHETMSELGAVRGRKNNENCH
jgi:hypothetical protein